MTQPALGLCAELFGAMSIADTTGTAYSNTSRPSDSQNPVGRLFDVDKERC
jgi:hypothetical protein